MNPQIKSRFWELKLTEQRGNMSSEEKKNKDLETLQTVIVNPSMPVRLLCLLVGIVIICFGSALYMTADLVCVVTGAVLFLIAGGTFGQIPTIAGIGTIITAFFMGPLIELFNVKVARPMLKGKKEAEK